MPKEYIERYERWLNADLAEEIHADLLHIKDDEKEIRERFSLPLQFGTAGLRGIMGAGIGRMNIYTVGQASQGFADYLNRNFSDQTYRGVGLCYDCRNNSELFATHTASVFAANNIKVYIFSGMRPTPELSFLIREKKLLAGINITASHNPKEYNGYKAYFEDGAQIGPDVADAVLAEIAHTDIFSDVKTVDFSSAVSSGMIEIVPPEFDEVYLERVMSLSIAPEKVKQAALSVVYTPFHGTGRELCVTVMERLGAKVTPVEQQMVPDGNFPTVASPNPENPEGFYLARELAEKTGADIILGTDPDADRVGLVVRDDDGEYKVLTGNQTGALLLDYVLSNKNEKGQLTKDSFAVKTIVTSELAGKIADRYGVRLIDTFTGFKFIAGVVAEEEEHGHTGYVMGYEESYGYNFGDSARDKDAVSACAMILEMAAACKLEGKTVLQKLASLYETYGIHKETTVNLVMKGLEGLDKMAALMASLRKDPPAEIGGYKVVQWRDYKAQTIVGADGEISSTGLDPSNVLYYTLENGTRFIVRPSGTEPKVKVYILAEAKTGADCAKITDDLRKAAEALA